MNPQCIHLKANFSCTFAYRITRLNWLFLAGPWVFPIQQSAEAFEPIIFLEGVDSAVLAGGDLSALPVFYPSGFKFC